MFDELGPRLAAHCDPTNPLAWRREPIFSLLKEQARNTWASTMTVAAKAALRVWIITPSTEIDLGEIDERAPIEIVKCRDGSAIVTVLPPIDESENIREHLNRLRSQPASGSRNRGYDAIVPIWRTDGDASR